MTGSFEWQGSVGNAWAQEWRLTDMSFAGLAAPLDAAIVEAAPAQGAALDIGCGAGVTSLALAAARPDLEITGVDLSQGLVDLANSRGKHAPNLRFFVADVTKMTDSAMPAARFDLAFSRHGVMFFDDPIAGFRAIRRLLADEARLVFSCFADVDRNPWATQLVNVIAGTSEVIPPGAATSPDTMPMAEAGPAESRAPSYVPGPFGFGDPAFVRGVLERSGFVPGKPELVNYRYRAGDGADAVAQALHFFQRIGPAARALAMIEPAARTAALKRLRALLAHRARDGAVEFPAAAWIWTARAEAQ